ncbi:hypothetical protein [Leptospira kirschneri]|uniref:hypothetical protein n=1 Tax=Leptospira kirschneri TaxID=29507 RepID=UPI00030483BB|nr:hypothetical protein [Leptospira kirschneri]EPG51156.1 hypothetical protein LEP1GSC049_2189 [Leptospira kirschneri serovar Cynopteri str. 3522 CT]KON77923.1 Uncharacterized protein NV38_0001424 [Leptospira kirschneri serovar Mozdok]KPZ75428.1 hypothetical protein APS47_02340 [Leptospira kirschneri serovar Mozdok]NDK04985.1 hypothetical protein [Leptospira kirschneri serovar Mozdok]
MKTYEPVPSLRLDPGTNPKLKSIHKFEYFISALFTKNGFLKFLLRRSSEIMKPIQRHVYLSVIIYHLLVIRMISI